MKATVAAVLSGTCDERGNLSWSGGCDADEILKDIRHLARLRGCESFLVISSSVTGDIELGQYFARGLECGFEHHACLAVLDQGLVDREHGEKDSQTLIRSKMLGCHFLVIVAPEDLVRRVPRMVEETQVPYLLGELRPGCGICITDSGNTIFSLPGFRMRV